MRSLARCQSPSLLLLGRSISLAPEAGFLKHHLQFYLSRIYPRLTMHRQLPIRRKMDELVNTAKALSDPTRVRIICALLEWELCVCELCDALHVTQSTLSTH